MASYAVDYLYFSSSHKINKSTRKKKIKNNSHVHEFETTHFHVEMADGRNWMFAHRHPKLTEVSACVLKFFDEANQVHYYIVNSLLTWE